MPVPEASTTGSSSPLPKPNVVVTEANVAESNVADAQAEAEARALYLRARLAQLHLAYVDERTGVLPPLAIPRPASLNVKDIEPIELRNAPSLNNVERPGGSSGVGSSDWSDISPPSGISPKVDNSELGVLALSSMGATTDVGLDDRESALSISALGAKELPALTPSSRLARVNAEAARYYDAYRAARLDAVEAQFARADMSRQLAKSEAENSMLKAVIQLNTMTQNLRDSEAVLDAARQIVYLRDEMVWREQALRTALAAEDIDLGVGEESDEKDTTPSDEHGNTNKPSKRITPDHIQVHALLKRRRKLRKAAGADDENGGWTSYTELAADLRAGQANHQSPPSLKFCAVAYAKLREEASSKLDALFARHKVLAQDLRDEVALQEKGFYRLTRAQMEAMNEYPEVVTLDGESYVMSMALEGGPSGTAARPSDIEDNVHPNKVDELVTNDLDAFRNAWKDELGGDMFTDSAKPKSKEPKGEERVMWTYLDSDSDADAEAAYDPNVSDSSDVE